MVETISITNLENLNVSIGLVDGQIASVQSDLEKFTESVGKNPVYAMEWGDEAFLGAARFEYLHGIRTTLVYVHDYFAKHGDFNRDVLDSMLRDLDRRHHQKMGVAGVSGSTSASRRLMDQARVEVNAEWFDDMTMGRWANRVFITEVLERFLPAGIAR